MYNKILLPTNGTDVAAKAIPHAIDLASHYNAELHIVSVAKGDSISEKSVPSIEKTRHDRLTKTRAQEIVAEVADEAEEAGRDYTTAVLTGSPTDVLTAYIEEEDIDLVVIGGRKQSPTGKMLFGSVTQSLLLHTDIPVTTL